MSALDMTPEELAMLTIPELRVGISTLQAEITRRELLVNAEHRMQSLQNQFLDARDGAQPAPAPGGDVKAWPAWTQPLGAHDAYPNGRVVECKGALWQNQLPFGNAHEPGTLNSGWLDVTEIMVGEAPPPAVEAEPWAPGVAYQAGEPVTVLGIVFWCVQGHTSLAGWEPPTTPALWTQTRPL